MNFGKRSHNSFDDEDIREKKGPAIQLFRTGFSGRPFNSLSNRKLTSFWALAPWHYDKKLAFERNFMNFGKRNDDAFRRDFMSFGK